MSGICAGQKIHYPARVQGGGLLRGCVSAFSGGNTALWLVFSVSRENLYARGEYFYIYVAMYYAAMLYLMVATVRTATAFQNRSRTLICPLTLFLGAATVIQIALPSLHVTWLCVTLRGGVVLYLLQRDVEPAGRPDRTLNRTAYLEPHRRDAPQRRGAGGVRCGQLQTDQRPLRPFAGRCLPCRDRRLHQKSLCPLRYCYRIGGDEFCVLLRDAADEARCAAALQSLLAERRKEITLLPTLSLGSAVFSGEDVVTVKDRADRALYCAKNELKARRSGNARRRQWGKGLNGSSAGKTPAHFTNGGTPMITDWNSPQGDFDPTEKQGELLMLLSGQQVTVHTSAEDDFDYMENEDVAFVVKNPHSEEDLLIELCGEFSSFLKSWHGGVLGPPRRVMRR